MQQLLVLLMPSMAPASLDVKIHEEGLDPFALHAYLAVNNL